MTPHWLPARTGTKPDGADRRRSLSFDGQGGEAGVAAAARRQFLVSSIAFPTIFVFSAFFEVTDLTAENAKIAENLFASDAASWRLCVFALHLGR
jgi:hypothetical protein